MVIAVRTERGSSGLEVVKLADDEAGRARLAREADILARAAHPGVVEVVAHTESSLRLRHRGTPLARLGAIAPDHAAALVRATAGIVDALHQQGIVHRRIDRDHILISERGRPHLCGFGEAGDGDADEQADDVAALGRLLDGLLDDAGDALWSPQHRGVRAAGRRRKALAAFRTAAAGAQRPEPGQRLTARQFATTIGDALPGLSLPTPPGADPDTASDDFGAIPSDIDPTADLGWSDLDLSVLAVDDDVHVEDDTEEDGAGVLRRNPYAALAALADPDPQPEAEPETEAGEQPPGSHGPVDDDEPDGEPTPDDHDDEATDDEATDHDPIVAALRSAMAREEVARQDSAPEAPPTDVDEPTTPADEPEPASAEPDPADPLSIPIRPGRIDAPPPPVEETPRRRIPLWLIIAVAAIGVVVGVVVARAVDPFGADTVSAADDDPAATGDAGDAGDDETETETETETPPTQPPECPTVAVPGPDTDGDGCASEVELDGRIATIDGVEIELGEDGDLVTLADDDCDGTVTPVLLRPATGEVFSFTEWSLDDPVEVTAADVVDGASELAPPEEPCGPAIVVAGDERIRVPAS